MPHLGQVTEAADSSRHEQIVAPETERRRCPRAGLSWALHVTCSGFKHPIRAITRDISRDGFYCFLTTPVTPGEHIECDILVPTHSKRDPEDMAFLRCRALVVRVEQAENASEFGVACRIEDYSIVHRASNGAKH